MLKFGQVFYHACPLQCLDMQGRAAGLCILHLIRFDKGGLPQANLFLPQAKQERPGQERARWGGPPPRPGSSPAPLTLWPLLGAHIPGVLVRCRYGFGTTTRRAVPKFADERESDGEKSLDIQRIANTRKNTQKADLPVRDQEASSSNLDTPTSQEP